MTSIDTVTWTSSLAERAARALGKPAPKQPEKICLLLDVSGSMADPAEPGVRKIDALRRIVQSLQAPSIFAFSRVCKRVTRETIPEPGGGTALHVAFARIKSHGVSRAVLVTDGLPDDEDAALREAQGLALDIFYVGPAPKPEFLDRLAQAARPGSRAEMASLANAAAPALQQRVRLMLTDGRS